jgi:ABC-type lipoprotein export system ATPase subunit
MTNVGAPADEAPATGEAVRAGETAIVARDLARHFRHAGETIRAVDGVSFALRPRQLAAITGPSGCGKSTLLYLLGSLERPTGGSVLVGGTDVAGLRGRAINEFRRRKIGFIFQAFHLIPNLTALENVMLPLQLAGLPPEGQRERARHLLAQVGIDDGRQAYRPGRLSGGQQQRVAIARALANDPAVILGDEPTGNLDAKTGGRVIGLLRDLAREGRTIVLVTHDRAVARQADTRLEMLDGRLVAVSEGVRPGD